MNHIIFGKKNEIGNMWMDGEVRVSLLLLVSAVNQLQFSQPQAAVSRIDDYSCSRSTFILQGSCA
jgi:hypothetical protein